MIICAAAYISYESILKIIKGVHSEINVDGAIYIMIFSIFVNIFVSRFLYKTSQKTGSVAIFADAEHLRTDRSSKEQDIIQEQPQQRKLLWLFTVL